MSLKSKCLTFNTGTLFLNFSGGHNSVEVYAFGETNVTSEQQWLILCLYPLLLDNIFRVILYFKLNAIFPWHIKKQKKNKAIYHFVRNGILPFKEISRNSEVIFDETSPSLRKDTEAVLRSPGMIAPMM